MNFITSIFVQALQSYHRYLVWMNLMAAAMYCTDTALVITCDFRITTQSLICGLLTVDLIEIRPHILHIR